MNEDIAKRIPHFADAQELAEVLREYRRDCEPYSQLDYYLEEAAVSLEGMWKLLEGLSRQGDAQIQSAAIQLGGKEDDGDPGIFGPFGQGAKHEN